MNKLSGLGRIHEANRPRRLIQKIAQVLDEESQSFQPRLLLTRLIAQLLPRYMGGRIRSQLLRAAAFRLGHGTVLMDMPILYGVGDLHTRLTVGEHVMINIGCTFDLSAPITIGDESALGHEVMLLTSSHLIGETSRRAGPLTSAPIVIETGVWLGARSVVLPGVTIGEGSVIAAGAIVTKSVPANVLAGGVPARVIRALDD